MRCRSLNLRAVLPQGCAQHPELAPPLPPPARQVLAQGQPPRGQDQAWVQGQVLTRSQPKNRGEDLSCITRIL